MVQPLNRRNLPVTPGPSPETKAAIPPEATVEVAALLSLSGGFLDAFTYVGHGEVFANAMTGNVVFLGIFAAAGDWMHAARHVPPIIAFFAGVFLAQTLRLIAKRSGGPSTALPCLMLEILFLAGLAILPQTTADIWIVLTVSFAAALQNSSFTKVEAWSYNSVMTTGNLRRCAESLFAGTIPRFDPGAVRQARVFATICGAFLIGALLGAWVTPLLGNPTLWIAAAILVIALILCWWRPN